MQAMGCFPFSQVWAGIGDSLLMNRVRKGKNSKLTVEKPGTHPVTRAVKVTVTGDKSCSYHVPRICCNETTSGASPNPTLLRRKHQTSQRWRTLFETQDQYSPNGQGHSKQGNTARLWHRPEQTKCSVGAWVRSSDRTRFLVKRVKQINSAVEFLALYQC